MQEELRTKDLRIKHLDSQLSVNAYELRAVEEQLIQERQTNLESNSEDGPIGIFTRSDSNKNTLSPQSKKKDFKMDMLVPQKKNVLWPSSLGGQSRTPNSPSPAIASENHTVTNGVLASQRNGAVYKSLQSSSSEDIDNKKDKLNIPRSLVDSSESTVSGACAVM